MQRRHRGGGGTNAEEAEETQRQSRHRRHRGHRRGGGVEVDYDAAVSSQNNCTNPAYEMSIYKL